VSPLLAKIALSIPDDHFVEQWNPEVKLDWKLLSLTLRLWLHRPPPSNGIGYIDPSGHGARSINPSDNRTHLIASAV
jgi:hypothetical protein